MYDKIIHIYIYVYNLRVYNQEFVRKKIYFKVVLMIKYDKYI